MHACGDEIRRRGALSAFCEWDPGVGIPSMRTDVKEGLDLVRGDIAAAVEVDALEELVAQMLVLLEGLFEWPSHRHDRLAELKTVEGARPEWKEMEAVRSR